ncbi:hypothetical protein J7K74_01570 [Candidatus Woesearchaeota archaeon]|nr:hypothetical protein [Candidatus Woesearchaeota archaeon]
MKNAEEGKEFMFSSGDKARNLKELLEKLRVMSDEEFFLYVNENKNDFSNWIRDVLGEETLAREIYHIRDRKEIIKKIELYISKREIERARKENIKEEKGEKRREEKEKEKEHKREGERETRTLHKERYIEYRHPIEYKTYSEIVRQLLFKEFFLGVLYGFVVALIIYAILHALQVI